uniref:Uncharacterized protein n=1 Tax=Vibrio genomosp. F6 TaxID=723172 RepID=A0A0H3ZSM8_9VIBR|nr:hypothetical protein [Vibrio genomosp. F6]
MLNDLCTKNGHKRWVTGRFISVTGGLDAVYLALKSWGHWAKGYCLTDVR